MARMAGCGLALLLGTGMLIAGCSDKTPAEKDMETPPETAPAARIPQPLQDGVEQTTTSACNGASALNAAVATFLDNPGGDTLKKARQAWRQAHSDYRRLAFLYGLAGQAMPQKYNDRDPIDAHPLLPGYLDQVPGYPHSGLTYSEVPLTPDYLRKEHQSTDFYYLTQGFHPLESLLWPAGASSAEETLKRYRLPKKQSEETVNAPDRRHDLLRLIANALNRDVQTLCNTENTAYLVTGLVAIDGNPGRAAATLDKRLGATIGKRLDAWFRFPDGEDHNGMPVAHSPGAATDFSELAAIVRHQATAWNGILLAGVDSTETLRQQMQALAKRLDAIDPSRTPVDTDALEAARQALAQVRETLVSISLNAPAASSEEAGQ
ncbi:hypothetical protein EZI54_10600 [Marinobacter halodurans]|uniref:Imelysin-like domain-containing protein n=1 Tax=Marinobacter halodurans TaxID=2528979 RepID=A0ABY1ZM18_9GAMM|nr:imelysin family protein [Marinobacter halodurans]TBW55883.1 hypothetical protein EZI54_10600 [Marinobacter halodurans]